MNLDLLAFPFFLAQEGVGMGRGPAALLAAGAVERISGLRHRVVRRTVPAAASGERTGELETVLALDRELAAQVASTIKSGAVPLVLAGSCSSAIGTLAGLEPVGIVWFDAHGDFNTPASSPSGFLDGMALAMCAGLCHRDALRGVVQFQPVPPNRIVHLGGRAFDRGEREAMEQAGVQVLTADRWRVGDPAAALDTVLDRLASEVRAIYLHVDIDVLDPERYPANQFSAPGGLSPAELIAALKRIGSRFEVRAAALTAYDPEFDPGGTTLSAGLEVLGALAPLLG